MNHQPFEEWLLVDETLTSEQSKDLEHHLSDCEHCRQLQVARFSVESLFRDVADIEPLPGFTARFQSRLNVERQLEIASRHRWQSWITLILIANAVSLFAILLGMQFFNTFDSVTELLLVWVYRLTSLLTVINLFQNFLAIIIRTVPGLLSPGGWAVLATLVSTGSLIWVLSMAKLAGNPRRA